MTSPTGTDWIAEGATVAIYSDSYHGPGSYRTATITKLTKTQIVLDDGQRFRRDHLTLTGGSRYTAPKLMPLDAPEVVQANAAGQFAQVARLTEGLARDHRNGRRKDVLAMLDEIEQAVAAARQAITGKENQQ